VEYDTIYRRCDWKPVISGIHRRHPSETLQHKIAEDGRSGNSTDLDKNTDGTFHLILNQEAIMS
jgi:hypothetical protein